jgi:acyl carrier protein
MPDINEILVRLTAIVQDCFDDDELVVTPELSAPDVDGWDSLANVRLMLAVERAFKVKFTAAEIGSFKNVGDLVQAISTKSPGAL